MLKATDPIDDAEEPVTAPAQPAEAEPVLGKTHFRLAAVDGRRTTLFRDAV